MKTCKAVFALLTILGVTLSSGAASSTPAISSPTGVQRPPPAAIERAQAAQLEKFRSESVQRFLAGRADLIAASHSESIRLMPAYQKTVFGRANAEIYYVAFFQRFTVQDYTRTMTETIDLGSKVVEFGEFTLKAALKSGARTHELSGKYMELWEKLDTGLLSLVTSSWNYDQRVEQSDDFRFSDVPGVQTAFQTHVPVNSPLTLDLAAIHALQEISICEHDANVWAQFFADDAVLYSNLGKIYEGKVAIAAYLERHVKEMPVFEKLDLRNDQIDVSGEYVIEYASHVANWKTGDFSGVNTGKNIGFWRREPNGSLRLFRQIGSYD